MSLNPHESALLGVVAEDHRALVGKILFDAAALLAAAASQHHEAAIHVQASRLVEGLKLLGQTIAAWESVRAAIDQSASLLGISAETLIGAGETPHELEVALASRTHVEHLNHTLQEVKRTVHDRDWSGLADVLEYDMTDLCQSWQQRLSESAKSLLCSPV